MEKTINLDGNEFTILNTKVHSSGNVELELAPAPNNNTEWLKKELKDSQDALKAIGKVFADLDRRKNSYLAEIEELKSKNDSLAMFAESAMSFNIPSSDQGEGDAKVISELETENIKLITLNNNYSDSLNRKIDEINKLRKEILEVKKESYNQAISDILTAGNRELPTSASDVMPPHVDIVSFVKSFKKE